MKSLPSHCGPAAVVPFSQFSHQRLKLEERINVDLLICSSRLVQRPSRHGDKIRVITQIRTYVSSSGGQ